MSLQYEHLLGSNSALANGSVQFIRPRDHSVPLHASRNRDIVIAAGGSVVMTSLQNKAEQRISSGHNDFITCLAVSRTLALFATGQVGETADVVLWDYRSGKELARFEEHDHGVAALAFSHDDRYLISCGNHRDARLFVYDTSNQTVITWHSLETHPTTCFISGGYIKDIKRRNTDVLQFVSGGPQSISFWKFDPMNREVQPLIVSSGLKQVRDYTALCFSADFEVLFAGTATGDVLTVLAKSRVAQDSFPVVSGGVSAMAMLESGILLVGAGDGSVATALAKHTELSLLHRIPINEGRISSISVSEDGADILAATAGGAIVKIKSAGLGELKSEAWKFVNSAPVEAVTFGRDVSEEFITAGQDLTLWNLDTFSPTTVARNVHANFACAAADLCVAGGEGGRLHGWDLGALKKLWTIDGATRGTAVTGELSRNLRFVAVGSSEGELRLWDLKTKEMITHLKEHTGSVNALRLFKTDQFAVTGSRDRSLMTWDLRAERRLTTHRERHAGINSLCVSDDQVVIVTATQEKSLSFWDLRMQEPAMIVELLEEPKSVSLNSSNTLLAYSEGKSVRLLDFRTASKLQQHVSVEHSAQVTSVAFSPDEKQVVSVGRDNCILIWNVFGTN